MYWGYKLNWNGGHFPISLHTSRIPFGTSWKNACLQHLFTGFWVFRFESCMCVCACACMCVCVCVCSHPCDPQALWCTECHQRSVLLVHAVTHHSPCLSIWNDVHYPTLSKHVTYLLNRMAELLSNVDRMQLCVCVCVCLCGVFLCVHAHTKVRQCVSMYSILPLMTNPTVTLVHLFFSLIITADGSASHLVPSSVSSLTCLASDRGEQIWHHGNLEGKKGLLTMVQMYNKNLWRLLGGKGHE